MKVKEIIELLDFISKKRIEEVNIETKEIKLTVKKNTKGNVVEQIVQQAPQVIHQAAPAVAAPAPAPALAPAPAAAPQEAPSTSESDKYITVKSPMIGTFYRASNPETPDFVEVGDKITPGQTVCIVEAMKLFNEIESEVSGTVIKVLVENASPVEYDQPLFLVDPS